MNRELFDEAYAILDGIPAERWDLGVIAKTHGYRYAKHSPHNCGTVCCAMGWLGLHPEFSPKAGFRTSLDGDIEDHEGRFLTYGRAAQTAFGISWLQAVNLFGSPGLGKYDTPAKMNDKARFRHRVKCFLAEQAG